MSFSSHLLKIRISCPKVPFSVSRNPPGGLIIALKSLEMKLKAIWVQIWTLVSPEQGANPPNIPVYSSFSAEIHPGSVLHEKCVVEVNKEFIKDLSKLVVSFWKSNVRAVWMDTGFLNTSGGPGLWVPGNDCIVDTVWSYHSRIKVRQGFVTLKINEQVPFCGNVNESLC